LILPSTEEFGVFHATGTEDELINEAKLYGYRHVWFLCNFNLAFSADNMKVHVDGGKFVLRVCSVSLFFEVH